MNAPVEIFFSYAHEDEGLMDDVRRQLIGAERRGLLVKWYDRLIPAGAELDEAIDVRLQSAQIILLLVSPFFIESRYCYGVEMKLALARHEESDAIVIPVILRPCLWQHEAIGRLLALPTDGKPLETWANRNEGTYNIAQGVLQAVHRVQSTKRHTSAS